MMNINPINFYNNIKINPIIKPRLNYKIQDVVSFSGNNKKPTSLRANYADMLSEVDTKRTRTVRQLREAYQAGEDISEDVEKLILSRIPTALKSAENFTKEHPEFDTEDIGQDLIRIVITSTNSELNTKGKCQNFGTVFYNLKDRYFSSILGKEAKRNNSDAQRYLAIQMEEAVPEEVHVQLERREADEELKADLEEALNRLRPRHREIIIKRFGLDGHKPMLLREIADESSSTLQNAKEIESYAIRNLQNAYINIQTMKKLGGSYED